ncbi:helix-turn-helix domain-containing protein [Pseudoalteromonas sp. R3]|uniref:helix-turn-helix domain-containing protein n=1 Tax=Pseudoalteromonas sp. R3 TaxID=1709477 RepID=UPI0006B45F39|nr:helix-turn-helix domain-containing protein [Pseudoalteromonas sp. R3]AZZ99965.1 helix-turn-helix domain-containing protein [Pseudoalteromonas sp. R3]
MLHITVFSPDLCACFDLGCLNEVLGDTSLQGRFFKTKSKPVCVVDAVDISDSLVALKQGDIVILCGWNSTDGHLGRQSVSSVEAFLRRGGKVVVVGHLPLPDYQLLVARYRTQITVLESGLPVLEWAIGFVQRNAEAEIANSIVDRLKLCPIKIAALSGLHKPPVMEGSARIKEVVEWAESHLEKVTSVDILAEKAFMSRRNFDRHFKEMLGQSPKDWLMEKRFKLAKSYLKYSDFGMEEVASLSGFGNYPNLRNCFSKKLGQSPNSYRIVSRAV